MILTNGEVDAVAGLLSLREGWPFAIHAHPRVLDTLAANSVFDVLPPARVPRRPIAIGAAFEPRLQDGAPSGLVVEAFRRARQARLVHRGVRPGRAATRSA